MPGKYYPFINEEVKLKNRIKGKEWKEKVGLVWI